MLKVILRVKNQFWVQRIIGFRKLRPVLPYRLGPKHHQMSVTVTVNHLKCFFVK